MRTSRQGFSLVEVTLAMGVAAFCLVVVFGLLPTGLLSNQAALEQTGAANLATSIAVDLQTAPEAAVSPRFEFDRDSTALQTAFARMDGKVAGVQDARYRSTVWCRPPSAAVHKTATIVRILITWPALSDPDAGQIPENYSGSFETVIALDRN